MRTILLIATLLGAALTVYGLIRALVEARKEATAAERRVQVMKELADEEKQEHEAVARRREAGDDFDMGAENERINQAFTEKYAEHDIIRPSMGNVAHLAAYESRRLLSLVLGSTRRDFTVAIVGVVVSTAASAASLYVTA